MTVTVTKASHGRLNGSCTEEGKGVSPSIAQGRSTGAQSAAKGEDRNCLLQTQRKEWIAWYVVPSILPFCANIISADVYAFFFYALPESGALSLPDLHQLIRDVWLTRLDDEIAQEIAARRQGRPKTTKQQKLEDRKAVETELYRTGMGAYWLYSVSLRLTRSRGHRFDTPGKRCPLAKVGPNAGRIHRDAAIHPHLQPRT